MAKQTMFKNQYETEDRHKKNEMEQIPDTYETYRKSPFEEHNEVHTNEKRQFKNIAGNTSVI